MADLELREIRKSYGTVEAVKGVSFSVASGAFVVLVGPSGCGKSTLLRAIAGLEDIGGGAVLIGGRDVTGLAPRQRNVAMVFQSYALYPYLSVFENIAFGLRARGVAADEVQRKVHAAADTLDIAPFLERRPRNLSGGQRQRVAIGRAIVRDADLYLFDEPLSNLDAKLRDGMREELKRLHARLGKTFIYVTHDQIEAMTLADRIILLRDGRIEQDGAPVALFEQPATRFAAEFIGSPAMNMLAVTRAGDGHGIRLTDGQTLSVDAMVPDETHGGITWGIRPEHLSLGAAPGSTIRGQVEVLQPTGSRMFATVTFGPDRVIAELDAHAQIAPGDEIALSVAMPRTTFFGPDGRRLGLTSGPLPGAS